MELSPDIKKVTVYSNAIKFEDKDSSKSFVLMRNGLTALQNDSRPPQQFDEEFQQRLKNFLAENFDDPRVVQDPNEFRVGPLPSLSLDDTTKEAAPNAGGLLGWIWNFRRPTEGPPKTVETPVQSTVQGAAQSIQGTAQTFVEGAASVVQNVVSNVQSQFQTTQFPTQSTQSTTPNFAFLQNVQTTLAPEYKQPEQRIPTPAVQYVNANARVPVGPCSTQRRSRRAAMLDPVKLAEIRAKDTARKQRSRECRRARGMYPW